MKLKYLYRVTYLDGTTYDQNVDDISIDDPTKSCYSDIRLSKVHFFSLSDGVNSYTLDLSDGGFSTNESNKFYLTDEQLTEFKLIHFRRVKLILSYETRSYNVSFVLGYEAKRMDGSSLTQYIIIK